MTRRTEIPAFALYGERVGLPDLLHVETIRDRAGPLDWEIAMHRHPSLVQFLWLDTGGGALRLDGGTHEFGPGTAIFLPRLCPHGFRFSPGAQGLVVTLPVAALTEAMEQAAADLVAPWLGAADAQFAALMQEMAREHAARDPYRTEALRARIVLLALWAIRASGGIAARQPRSAYGGLVTAFLDLLEREFRAQKETVFYAAALHRTASHLTRACKAVTGQTASALIRERVMLEARRELAYTARRVAEIGYDLGYEDPAHFAKAFRAATGHAPRDFRAQVARGS